MCTLEKEKTEKNFYSQKCRISTGGKNVYQKESMSFLIEATMFPAGIREEGCRLYIGKSGGGSRNGLVLPGSKGRG